MRVIVVGAGIIGLSVAVQLAERGATVEIIEAARPGGGLTTTTFAWLNAGFLRVDRAVWELRTSSIDRWRAMFPGATWLHPGGSLHLAAEPTDEAGDEAGWWAELRTWGEPIRTISAPELLTLEPDVRGATASWALFERDAWVETDGAVDALLTRLRQAAGVVVAGNAVRAVDAAPGHARVVLVDGTTRAADVVVIAAARATPGLVEAASVVLRPATHPSVPGLLLLTRPVTVRLGRIVRVDDLVLRPAPGGRLLIQAGAIDRRLRLDQPEATTADQVRELLARARDVLSGRQADHHLEPETVTIAARALPQDGLPIVGWSGEPGRSAYVVVAHSGIVLAPALARIAAEEMLTGHREPSQARYQPRSMATDGSGRT